MNNDLISRSALIARHCDGCAEDIIQFCKTDPLCGMMMWVVEEPAVDAVEVVRCKDCKHHKNDFYCFYRKDDDFCSWGERREDG